MTNKKRDIKEKAAIGVFVISILAIIVLLFFAFKGSLTGKVIENTEGSQNIDNQDIENKISCTDSDGRNYLVKGVVSYCNNGCSSSEDSCSGKKVIEWYCENNEKKSEEHSCEYDCDKGVCVKLVSDYKSSSGGSSGDGSGGGGSSTSSTSTVAETPAQTFSLGEISSQQTVDLVKNENVKFTLANIEYSITLQDFSLSQATLSTIGVINVGEDKKVDLDSDGDNDVYMRIDSISVITKKVRLIISKIV